MPDREYGGGSYNSGYGTASNNSPGVGGAIGGTASGGVGAGGSGYGSLGGGYSSGIGGVASGGVGAGTTSGYTGSGGTNGIGGFASGLGGVSSGGFGSLGGGGWGSGSSNSTGADAYGGGGWGYGGPGNGGFMGPGGMNSLAGLNQQDRARVEAGSALGASGGWQMNGADTTGIGAGILNAGAFARTLAGEVGGLPGIEQQAAANTMLNRIALANATGAFPQSIQGILSAYDANGLRPGTKQNKAYKDALPGTPAHIDGLKALSAAYNAPEDLPQAVMESTHYYNPSTANPAWGQGFTQFGAHRFGNDATMPGASPQRVADARNGFGIGGPTTMAGGGGTDTLGMGGDFAPVGSPQIGGSAGTNQLGGGTYGAPGEVLGRQENLPDFGDYGRLGSPQSAPGGVPNLVGQIEGDTITGRYETPQVQGGVYAGNLANPSDFADQHRVGNQYASVPSQPPQPSSETVSGGGWGDLFNSGLDYAKEAYEGIRPTLQFGMDNPGLVGLANLFSGGGTGANTSHSDPSNGFNQPKPPSAPSAPPAALPGLGEKKPKKKPPGDTVEPRKWKGPDLIKTPYLEWYGV